MMRISDVSPCQKGMIALAGLAIIGLVALAILSGQGHLAHKGWVFQKNSLSLGLFVTSSVLAGTFITALLYNRSSALPPTTPSEPEGVIVRERTRTTQEELNRQSVDLALISQPQQGEQLPESFVMLTPLFLKSRSLTSHALEKLEDQSFAIKALLFLKQYAERAKFLTALDKLMNKIERGTHYPTDDINQLFEEIAGIDNQSLKDRMVACIPRLDCNFPRIDWLLGRFQNAREKVKVEALENILNVGLSDAQLLQLVSQVQFYSLDDMGVGFLARNQKLIDLDCLDEHIKMLTCLRLLKDNGSAKLFNSFIQKDWFDVNFACQGNKLIDLFGIWKRRDLQEILLKTNKNLDLNDTFIYYDSIAEDNAEFLTKLLEKKAPESLYYYLSIAINYGALECTKVLLEYNSLIDELNFDSLKTIVKVAKKGSPEVKSFNIECDKSTAEMTTCALEILKIILEKRPQLALTENDGSKNSLLQDITDIFNKDVDNKLLESHKTILKQLQEALSRQ